MSTTEATVQIQRVSRVDEVVRERGWSLAVAASLATEFGVSTRTVHRYWKCACKWTRRTMSTANVETWRARQVQALDDDARAARNAGDYATAVRAREVQAKIIGTIAPLKADVRVSGAVAHVPVTTDTVALLTELHALAEQRASAIEATSERVPVEAGRPGEGREDGGDGGGG